MSDSFTCKVQVHGPKSHVNCEPDPAPTPAQAATKANPPKAPAPPKAGVYGPPPPPSPGVTKLLEQAQAQSAASKPFVKPPVASKPDLGHTALKCAGEIDALAVLVLGGTRGPLIAGLTAFKVGLDLGKCFARENAAAEQSASNARAISECESHGGTPLGVVDRGDHNELICAVPRSPKP
jgi:hypothetical protein